MYIPYSCSYVENGIVNYIFAWDSGGFNEEPADQYFTAQGKVVSNGNVYTKTGNTITGIPGFDDTNFYSTYGI